jgi:predicted HicB family RNase H-like nuclease
MDRQSIHVRLPKTLHDRLRDLAAEQHVSLNTLLVAMIASSVGFKLEGGS